MMLRALFDERRRKELQDAVKAGRPLAFRKKGLASDWPGTPDGRKRFLLDLLKGAGLSDEEEKKAFKDAAGKSMEDASVEDIERFLRTRYPDRRPVAYDDIASSSKPHVIAGVGGDLFIRRDNRGGRG